MNPRFYQSMAGKHYEQVWNKYRPAILQMMISAEEGPQQYQFYEHEFTSINPRDKAPAFAFTVFQGKSLNPIKSSLAATDLLYVLNTSRKATELMGHNKYEFVLSRNLMLQVTKLVQETEDPAEQGAVL